MEIEAAVYDTSETSIPLPHPPFYPTPRKLGSGRHLFDCYNEFPTSAYIMELHTKTTVLLFLSEPVYVGSSFIVSSL